MRLPRALPSGDVPTGPVPIQSEKAALAQVANQVASFTNALVEEQAQAELADSISAADVATREYLAKAKDTRVNTDTGRPTFETAEQDFDKFYSKLEKAAADNATTARARGEIKKQLRSMRVQGAAEARNIARQHRIDDIVTRTNQSVDRFVAVGDFDSARLALRNQRQFYAPDTLAKTEAFIDSAETGALHDQAVSNVMTKFGEALNTGQGAEFIRAFREQSPFEQDETAKLIGRMHTQRNQYNAEQEALDADFKQAEARAMQARLFVLDQRIDAGDAGAMQDIKTLLADGDLTAAQATAKRRRLDKALEENRSVTDAYQALSAGIPLDPKNPAHMKLAETEFANIIRDTGGIETPEARSAVTRLVKQTNIVPDTLKKSVNAVRIAGSVEQVAAMADVVARISEAAPLQYNQFSDDQQVFYGQVNDLVRANMDPQLAVEAVRERQSQPAPDRKVADDRYRTALKATGNAEAMTDWIDREYDGWFSANPRIPLALESDYNAATRAFFDKTGDIEQARELAQKQMAGIWSVSEINGQPEMMRYAPERVHGEWAIEQLTADMNAVGVSPGVWELVSDPITARTKGGSYAVMRRTDASLEPIMLKHADGTLQAARFQPDYTKSTQFDVDEKRKRELVNRANRKRQGLLPENLPDFTDTPMGTF